MNKVGQILTNLSIAENFKEWKFGQLAWIIGLVTFRITTDRRIYERVFIMDVFVVNWKTVAEFLQNILRQRLSGVGDWSFTGRV